MQDVMIDLETFGTGTNALILSIGAQAFKLETQLMYPQRAIHLKIDVEDAQRCGQVIDASTVMWWMKQSDAARGHLTIGYHHGLRDALNAFSDWLKAYGPNLVWGNGATFDISILTDAYNLLGIEVPWKFRDVRDMRTIVDMATRLGIAVPYVKPVIEHDAQSDATAQVLWINQMFASMQGKDVKTDALHQAR